MEEIVLLMVCNDKGDCILDLYKSEPGESGYCSLGMDYDEPRLGPSLLKLIVEARGRGQTVACKILRNKELRSWYIFARLKQSVFRWAGHVGCIGS
jgi:hypothetical protein